MSKRMPSFVDLAHRTAVTGLVGLGVSMRCRSAPSRVYGCVTERSVQIFLTDTLYLLRCTWPSG